MKTQQKTKFTPIVENSFVEKRIGIENNQGIYTGQYQVLNIVFTGTEDVAVIQHLLTKSVECVDVALLRALTKAPEVAYKTQGNVLAFAR